MEEYKSLDIINNLKKDIEKSLKDLNDIKECL